MASEHVVLGERSPALLLRQGHHALAAEHPLHRAGVGHGAAVPGDGDPDVGGGAVPVVGEALDEQGDAGRTVRLVHQRLVVGPPALGAGTALDRPVDVVVGDRALLGLLDGVVEGRIAGRIATAHPRSDLDVLDQLREQLAAPCVDHRLLVLGGRPFGVSRHSRDLNPPV